MTGARPGRFGDLGPRVASGVALALVGLLFLRLGGGWFAGFAALAAAAMLWEMHSVATGEDALLAPAFVATAAAGALAVVLTWSGGPILGAGALLVGAFGARLTPQRDARPWLVAGLVYIGGAMCFATLLRDGLGFAAALWLVLVVVAADVGAYFAGRAIGGPKLWPAVSPAKTRSGAVGGLAAAVLVGIAVALAASWPMARVAALSLVLAMASQAGDLLESALKRHFGVKDASGLIPGHGGVLDRLDGVMGALWVFGLYVLAGGRLEG